MLGHPYSGRCVSLGTPKRLRARCSRRLPEIDRGRSSKTFRSGQENHRRMATGARAAPVQRLRQKPMVDSRSFGCPHHICRSWPSHRRRCLPAGDVSLRKLCAHSFTERRDDWGISKGHCRNSTKGGGRWRELIRTWFPFRQRRPLNLYPFVLRAIYGLRQRTITT